MSEQELKLQSLFEALYFLYNNTLVCQYVRRSASHVRPSNSSCYNDTHKLYKVLEIFSLNVGSTTIRLSSIINSFWLSSYSVGPAQLSRCPIFSLLKIFSYSTGNCSHAVNKHNYQDVQYT